MNIILKKQQKSDQVLTVELLIAVNQAFLAWSL